jgi:hypothetical protein
MGELMRYVIVILLLGSAAMGANHYVLPTGSGSKTGADWANACAGFTGSCSAAALIRGDVYYVGGGSYSSYTFKTAESGTLIIRIKGATGVDHGTSAGWNSSYGVDVAQALFSYPLSIWNGYQIFDGNTGSPTNGVGSYGFRVALPSSCSNGNLAIQLGPGGTSVSKVQLSHFYLLACPGDVGSTGIYLQTKTTATNFTYSYNYFDGFEAAIFDHATGTTIDHNYFINAYSSADHHGNQMDFVDAEVNPVISNNMILNCAGTVCLGANDNGNTCSQGLTGAKIYGNVFDAKLTSGGTQPVGDGIIGSTTRCFMANSVIYNNTFTGSTSGWLQACVTSAATCGSATGNTAENNVVWNEPCAMGSAITTHDYNSYLSCTDTAPTEAHGQTVSLNPFVASSSNNFNLSTGGTSNCPSTTAVCSGLVLNTPYNVDPNGVTRGVNGVWDRGAFEYSGGPIPPNSLQVIVN